MGKSHKSESKAATFTHFQWTARDANRIYLPSLIDREEPLNELGSVTKEQILKNQRLWSLMNKRRNHFAMLPDQRSTARHFYCGSCGSIPNPLHPDPKKRHKPAVHLCRNGHAVCRTCLQNKPKCLFSPKDYVNVYQTPPTDEALERHTKPRNVRFGDFGEETRLCSAKLTQFKCGLLKTMIVFTEFACKNYYNWCCFRGRGAPLRNHEARCKHRFPVSSTSTDVACLADPKSGEGLQQSSTGSSQKKSEEGLEKISKKKSGEGSQQTSEKKSEEGSQQASKKKSEMRNENETAIRSFDLIKAQDHVRELVQQLQKEHGKTNVVLPAVLMRPPIRPKIAPKVRFSL